MISLRRTTSLERIHLQTTVHCFEAALRTREQLFPFTRCSIFLAAEALVA